MKTAPYLLLRDDEVDHRIWRVVDKAIDVAAPLLRLTRHSFVWVFVHGPLDHEDQRPCLRFDANAWGSCSWWKFGNRPLVAIRDSLSPVNAYSTMTHELKHCRQFLDGHTPQRERDALEADARSFDTWVTAQFPLFGNQTALSA